MSAQGNGMVPASGMLTRRNTCRGCGSADLVSFLSLGEVPLANSFLAADQLDQPEPRFPLEVFFCANCSLVQLLHVVNPAVLFSNYLYRTGTNQTIARHNAALAGAAIGWLSLGSEDRVVEIGSNDGSLLRCFQERGVRTVGVEPAKNIARIAREAGIETLDDFFNAETAAGVRARYGPASLIIANNVLAHVDGGRDFLSACRGLLRQDGHVLIEVPYLVEMLLRLEYDTIYHEHLCYFSVTSLMRLFAEAGLVLEQIDRVEIHGGSLRLWARHADGSGHSASVLAMAREESGAGLTGLVGYQKFAKRVERHRQQLCELLLRLKSEGRTVAGYGAPAKGNTLLCYCGIGTDLLSYTVDRSPLKVGLCTPGMHIPIAPLERIFREQPDFVLILAWNFAEEILETLQLFRQRGGRCILPIPEPTIV